MTYNLADLFSQQKALSQNQQSTSDNQPSAQDSLSQPDASTLTHQGNPLLDLFTNLPLGEIDKVVPGASVFTGMITGMLSSFDTNSMTPEQKQELIAAMRVLLVQLENVINSLAGVSNG